MPNIDNETRTLVPTEGTVGAVMVLGAGVSGIQAALDLATSGFKVYLVDKGPAIGGKMSQLDKTFPTNDCSMCILSPKFIECSTNPNISIITGAQVDGIEGEAGNFKVTLLQEPRYVDEEKCTGCGTCAEYCPVNILDTYNEDLATLKCIHIPFSQAVPAVSVIDPTQCLFTLRKICQICVPTCKNNAIDFHQHERKLEIQVGGVILAPGYEPFEPEIQSQYGYHRLRNVVTSLEFERILSASGPFQGELVRPSDGKPPQKIAWIQCVGSRDTTVDNTYCSAVCCMYAIKQVILSKEHDPDLEAVILHNDIRAYGKGFERYYERAKDTPGVSFIWSKTSVVREMPDTNNVLLRYRVNGTEVRDEEFDLVVLSVGLTSPAGIRELTEKLAIKTNPYGFCESPHFSPVETSRPGIYACGVFHAPMDIPDSVTMASGAASLCSQLLSDERHTLTEEKQYPPEQDITGLPPRVGVFVCHCGTNIFQAVDVARVTEYARALSGVVHAEEYTFSCSIDSVTHMVETIKDKGLNRVVVAACTPRTHEPVFQDALRQAGLNPYLFEFANIREQCSWVHMRDRQAATTKAQDLVRMAVAKAKLLTPLSQLPYNINHAGLVIGGGISGMVSALSLAQQGFTVHLVEKAQELGGIAKRISYTVEGGDVQAFLQELTQKVYANLLIHVHTQAEITEFSGYVGNFTTRITVGARRLIKEISHGITIVATGAEELRPTEYLYGKDPQVVTALELEEEIEKNSEKFTDYTSLVMIQCVGSRESERPYCSRVCCTQAIKNALHLKEINPGIEIHILYRDMRTYGFREDYYQRAAEHGVKFIRYDIEDKPEVERVQENGHSILRVTVAEPTLGQRLMLDADMVALGVATVPSADNTTVSQLLKVPLTEDDFFMEAHMKLRPVDFATDGIFMCGLAHSPKFIDESIAQAQAAASRAMTILAQEQMKSGGAIATVTAGRCTGCGLCEEVCPFHAIEIDTTDNVAVVNEALCKGCGVCASSCRSGAVDIGGVSDEETMSLVRAF
ncbi:MAG: CoB--CoM heterodisulfide reductase iron-sulfur subunit A family protein [Deltaproteobacteria bacterium]|nr:CoB--CoM heterodisulfide reductase iron-sulfur subunit A family protein [Deltaproteobacteria bacterium]